MVNRHACRDCGRPAPTPRCATCSARANGPRRSTDRHTGNASYRRIRLEALERDGYRCTYCGRAATEVDHVVPIAAGGPNTIHNLTASCRACNRRKGAKTTVRAAA